MKEYTEEQWLDENRYPLIFFQLTGGPFAFGSTLPCPSCQTVGFFAPRFEPRQNDVDRKYRACKFCGFWQELTGYMHRQQGGEPYRCVMVGCTQHGAFDWKVPGDTREIRCGNCGSIMQEVKWPTDDPSHPFHELKKRIVQC